MEVTWAQLKDFFIARGLPLQWIDLDDRYWLCALDGYFKLFSFIHKTAESNASDLSDFETNYKNTTNKSIQQYDLDGKLYVHSTPRKRGLFTCFIGRGDSQTDQSKIGGGTQIVLHHQILDPTSQVIYVDLNTIINETYAHSGQMMWKDALNDLITLETVSKVSTYESGSNTTFAIYAGYLIIPAPGNGNINVTNPVLVEVPVNEFNVRAGAGYWDATYNTSTKQFENIAANPYGTGRFNMFAAEIVFDRFIDHMALLGDGYLSLDTYDASQVGHNMRLKVTLDTIGTDHEWYWNASLKPYRKRTC
jgi:hypothetical protein